MIPAGGSGQLTARMRTTHISPGRKVKSISVRTDSEEHPDLRLTLAVEIYHPLQVFPRRRVDLNPTAARGDSERLLARRGDGLPLRLKVEETGPLSVGIEAVAPDDIPVLFRPFRPTAEDRWIHVSVPAWTSAGSRAGTLVVGTNLEEAPTVTVPWTVRPVRELTATPPRVVLEPGDGGQEAGQVTVRVVRSDGRPFRVLRVVSSARGVVEAGHRRGGPRSRHEIWIRATDRVKAGGIRLPVRTRVTVEAEPGSGAAVVEIPVTIRAGGAGASEPHGGAGGGTR